MNSFRRDRNVLCLMKEKTKILPKKTPEIITISGVFLIKNFGKIYSNFTSTLVIFLFNLAKTSAEISRSSL